MKLRYTEKSFVNVRVAVDKQKAKIVELETLMAGFDKEFWKGVVARLLSGVEELRRYRNDNYPKMSEAELKASIALESANLNTIYLPQRVIDELKNLRQEYSKSIGYLNEHRDKIV